MADFEASLIGDPKHRLRWERWTIKGSVVKMRRRYLEAHGQLDAVRSVLSGDALKYVNGDVMVSSRLPYPPLVDVDRAITTHAMGGDVAKMHLFGRENATHDLGGGLYRGILKLIGGRLSISVYSTAYQMYFSPGRIESRADDDGVVTIALRDLVLPRYMCTYGFTGYVDRMLELAGAPSKLEHNCVHDGASACTWRVSPLDR